MRKKFFNNSRSETNNNQAHILPGIAKGSRNKVLEPKLVSNFFRGSLVQTYSVQWCVSFCNGFAPVCPINRGFSHSPQHKNKPIQTKVYIGFGLAGRDSNPVFHTIRAHFVCGVIANSARLSAIIILNASRCFPFSTIFIVRLPVGHPTNRRIFAWGSSPLKPYNIRKSNPCFRIALSLARWKGLEPLTYWFVASHSIQLSYQRRCSRSTAIL